MTSLVQDYIAHIGQDGKNHTVRGDVRILPAFPIPQLDTARNVLVYLPPSYASTDRRYPVLYMQDGQNLFDHQTAFANQDWEVDETMERLSGDGYQAIVVGIYHGGEQRLIEYNPFPGRWGARGEAYVEFVCDTLKPVIDAEFRTIPAHNATGILGSSMGALISLYAFFRRPEIFGLCGAMSPSLFVAHGAIAHYVRQQPYNQGKIYLDNGTREPSARQMYEILRDKGYIVRTDLKYVAEHGGQHTESAWARRLPGAVRFLLHDWKTRQFTPKEFH